MRNLFFLVFFYFLVYPFFVFGEENSVEQDVGKGEVGLEDVSLKQDSPNLLEKLVKEGHLTLDRGEEQKNILKTKGSKRVWVEFGIGAGIYLGAGLLASTLLLYPISAKGSDTALNVASPIAILMAAAGSGAGVHLGGYLMDNMGEIWAPYVGAMAGGFLSMSIELVGHFYGNGLNISVHRGIAYASSVLFSLGGALIGAELSHKFAYEKKIRDSYMILPAVSLGNDYQSFGLQVIF